MSLSDIFWTGVTLIVLTPVWGLVTGLVVVVCILASTGALESIDRIEKSNRERKRRKRDARRR